MNFLTTHLEQISNDVNQILEKTEPMKHPLIELIRYTTHEQREALDHLLPLQESDQHSDPDLDKIRPYLAIIYQNNEVSEPTMRAWVRAVEWMPSFETEYVEEIESLYRSVREQLNNIADLMKQHYGEAAIKYLIPSFYLGVQV
ncbi:hypothetical protein PO903_17620 [Paenibacillus sp. PK4536]|uniref:hypothetical protein n=1 Tax=Paenibacillus sp. PK4536 TaxID=3024576 RepID=UPI002359540E|nr:hypothetical protein [Paenibacillus sp. PK4536]WIM38451.1 hypothetical protein PO903_17620 [Paenibacillus sp. PK4536]